MTSALLAQERLQISSKLGESHFREYKSVFHGPPGNKQIRSISAICKDIGEAIVAFANADGGEIIIGIEDNGQVTGLGDLSESALARILCAPNTHVLSTTAVPSVRTVRAEVDGKEVIAFSTPKSSTGIHLTSDGRCLKRSDLETIPIATEALEFDKHERASIEYDREFVDGATIADLDADLLQIVADQISPGMSAEKCLQYLGIAEYKGPESGVIMRRAALLLFAKDITRWHPRCQVRVMKVSGTELGTGSAYNVTSDEIVRKNITRLIEYSWATLRPFLVQTTFDEDARFKVTFMYPENACREALINAIAHRDYSDEGTAIELYIFDDRIEIKNPGALLTTISVSDLKEMKGVHQSRNSYIARTLRELGYMRELGEGMRRIFELMQSNELELPEIESTLGSFNLKLHHKAMYSNEELLWLEQFSDLNLTAEDKAVVLMGRNGSLISLQDIWSRLGIVDTEHYRQILHSLQTKGVLKTEIAKEAAKKLAKKKRIGVRRVPRFKIVAPAMNKQKKGSPEDQAEEVSIQTFEVFVGNVPFDASEEELYDIFSGYGTIERVHIPRRYNSKLGKGYAFVMFAEISAAEKAITDEQAKKLGGRFLYAKPAATPVKQIIPEKK